MPDTNIFIFKTYHFSAEYQNANKSDKKEYKLRQKDTEIVNNHENIILMDEWREVVYDCQKSYMDSRNTFICDFHENGEYRCERRVSNNFRDETWCKYKPKSESITLSTPTIKLDKTTNDECVKNHRE